MSEHNPNQLRLIGSLADYDRGENVQYPVPVQESTDTATRTLEAEAALGTLLMRDTSVIGAKEAVQEPIPYLLEELASVEKTIPDNIIRGEE